MKTVTREQLLETIINDLQQAGIIHAGAETDQYLQVLDQYIDYDLMRILLNAHQIREIALAAGFMVGK